jgi:hypothetical protein
MRNQCNSPPLLELYWNWLPFSMYSMYRYWQVVCMCMYWSKWGCRNSTFHTYAWRMVWTYYDMLMAELVLAWVPGVPGTCIILGFTAWHPRILADQLTLLKPGGQIMPTTLLHTWEPQLQNPNTSPAWAIQSYWYDIITLLMQTWISNFYSKSYQIHSIKICGTALFLMLITKEWLS